MAGMLWKADIKALLNNAVYFGSMPKETLVFIVQMLAILLVIVPWWLYRRLRGLPFDDGSPVGQPDAFYWWAVTALWLLSTGVAFLLGGWRGMLLFWGAMAGLALLWALVWTPTQSIRQRWACRNADTPSVPLLLFHQRFYANFRSALIELPARLVDGL